MFVGQKHYIFSVLYGRKTKTRWWMRKPAHSVLLVGEQRLDWGLGGGSECQSGCRADILLHSLYVFNRKKKNKKSGGLTDHTPPQRKCYRLADGIQKNKMGPARCPGDKMSHKGGQTRKLLQGFSGFFLGYINCSRSGLNLLPVSWSSCKQQGCAGLAGKPGSPCFQTTAQIYVLPVIFLDT